MLYASIIRFFMKGIMGLILLYSLLGLLYNNTLWSQENSSVIAYPLPTASSQTQTFYIYLPIVFKPESHFYAQAIHNNFSYYGIKALIETADPKIREPIFSYASINLSANNGKWIETGWIKSAETDCTPSFVYAIDPGIPIYIDNVVPTIGQKYQHIIERISDGHWKLMIKNESGSNLLVEKHIFIGITTGNTLQTVGEVDSVLMLNDMGIAGILSLRWKDSTSIWRSWNGWNKGVEDNPPYSVVSIASDPNNAVQIRGNNGIPVPLNAICP